jgi:hypothetical protein
MRYPVLVLWALLLPATSAIAQLSIGIGLPHVSIGINVPVYPNLVPVPGYPVYYAPGMNSNYFFYDGMYWVYQGDNWYASSWYNGPWQPVAPEAVPLFVLRVPVRYYREPPLYFRGWRGDAPPRWGEHWGGGWASGHVGWDRWDRASAPRPAPLPSYQRQYSGNRYPAGEQQQALQGQNYHYQPRDAAVKEQFQGRPAQEAPAAFGQRPPSGSPPAGSRPQNAQRERPAQSFEQKPPTAMRPQPGQNTARPPGGPPQREERAPVQPQGHQPPAPVQQQNHQPPKEAQHPQPKPEKEEHK